MKKNFLLLLVLPILCLATPSVSKAQSGVNALMNVVETLQFLKDIKENKSKVEGLAKEIKTKYSESDSSYKIIKEKYAIVKLAGDNVLNNLVIDLMDKDKRKLFADRPGFINDLYKEDVLLYNHAVDDFNAAYLRTKKGDTGFLDIIKKLAELFIGDLISATKKLAIEILIEKIKRPYTMKSWSEI